MIRGSPFTNFNNQQKSFCKDNNIFDYSKAYFIHDFI